MQNKPNLLNTQMNVTKVLTNDYENIRLHRRGKNKPNQTQFPQKPTSAPKINPKNHQFSQFRIILIPLETLFSNTGLIDKLCEDLLQKCLRVIRIGSKVRAVISASPSEISFRGSPSHSHPAWYCGYKYGFLVSHSGFAEIELTSQATASGEK